MNFGELKTRVSKLLQDANNTAVSDSDVGTAINDAVKFWKKHRFWFNEETDVAVTLTVSDPVISDMPTDILFPIQKGGIVIDYSGLRYDLEKIGTSKYDMMNSEATGIPRYYTLRNGQYEVYPYPDQAYTAIVRYIKDYDDLVDATDTNDFTDNADNLIAYQAAARLSGDLRQDADTSSRFASLVKEEQDSLIGMTNTLNSTGKLSINH